MDENRTLDRSLKLRLAAALNMGSDGKRRWGFHQRTWKQLRFYMESDVGSADKRRFGGSRFPQEDIGSRLRTVTE